MVDLALLKRNRNNKYNLHGLSSLIDLDKVSKPKRAKEYLDKIDMVSMGPDSDDEKEDEEATPGKSKFNEYLKHLRSNTKSEKTRDDGERKGKRRKEKRRHRKDNRDFGPEYLSRKQRREKRSEYTKRKGDDDDDYHRTKTKYNLIQSIGELARSLKISVVRNIRISKIGKLSLEELEEIHKELSIGSTRNNRILLGTYVAKGIGGLAGLVFNGKREIFGYKQNLKGFTNSLAFNTIMKRHTTKMEGVGSTLLNLFGMSDSSGDSVNFSIGLLSAAANYKAEPEKNE